MGLLAIGDDDDIGRDALPIAVALSDSEILGVSGIRGDKGAGSKLRSTIGSDGPKEVTGGTTISAGGGARLLLGTSVDVSNGGCSGCTVAGILGLELGVSEDCEVLLDLRGCSEADSSAGRGTVGSVLLLEFSDIRGRDIAE